MRAAPLPSNLEQDIRTEQVRLVFRSMKSSLYLGSALALTLTLVFHNEENHNAVLSWLAAVIMSRIVSVSYVHVALRRGINAKNTSRHIYYMCAIKRLQEDKRELERLQAEWDAQHSLTTQESAR